MPRFEVRFKPSMARDLRGIPADDMRRILAAAREAGAISGHYGLLSLPHELTEVFTAWLETHAPGRAEHFLRLLRQTHGGAVYRAEFGGRRRGTGTFADLLAQRFRIAARRLGMDRPLPPLDTPPGFARLVSTVNRICSILPRRGPGVADRRFGALEEPFLTYTPTINRLFS